MRDVYEQNPKLGDAATLTKQLDESSQTVERLRSDISKYEVCIGMVAGIQPYDCKIVVNFTRTV